MKPADITLSDHYQGDTWIGIQAIGPVRFYIGEDQSTTYPPESDLVSCAMQFRNVRDQLGHTLSSDPGEGDGVIEILDAATWEMKISEQDLPLTPGKWDWDLETIDADGKVLTIYGGTISVIKDQTRL